MFGLFKKKNKAQETKASEATTLSSNDMPEGAPAVMKLYAIALDQSCKMARDLLQGRGIKYQEIDVTGNGSLISWLRRETGEVTFPRVFLYGKHIGGYEQLRSLDYSGQLEQLLRGEGLDEFLKEEEQVARETEEWSIDSIIAELKEGKTLKITRSNGIELMMWAEVFANPPAVYYEGKKFAVTELPRLVADIAALIEQGEANADWTEDD
jgi:glutaredoxin 3